MKEGEFAEVEFIGFVNGEKFDEGKHIIPVGKGEVLKGMDEELLKHEVGEEFEFDIPPEKAFGNRNPSLIRIIPLGELKKHNINPYPGLTLNINGILGVVRSVSGGRVIVDFNHPLAGKTLHYKVKIIRKIEDDAEKIKGLIKTLDGADVEVQKVNDKFQIKGDVKNKELLAKKIKNLLGVDVEWTQ